MYTIIMYIKYIDICICIICRCCRNIFREPILANSIELISTFRNKLENYFISGFYRDTTIAPFILTMSKII